MITEKAPWRQIVASDFAVPTATSPTALLPTLLDGLGSIDPELRDGLCYEILGTWVERGVYGPEEVRRMLPALLAGLRGGIGAGENDQVFRRTFSVLILGEIIGRDGRAPFLTAAEFRQIFDAGLQYLAEEQDLRGYVAEKGWAHSVAHTADLLGQLAGNPRAGAVELRALLQAMGAKLAAPTEYVLVARETYRVGRAVLAVVRRALLQEEEVCAWVRSLGADADAQRRFVRGEGHVRDHNLQGFLAALYVMVAQQAGVAWLAPALHAALKTHLPRFV